MKTTFRLYSKSSRPAKTAHRRMPESPGVRGRSSTRARRTMTDDGTTFRRYALSRRGGIRRRIRSGCALCGLLAAASLAIAPPLRAAPPDLSDVPLENLLNVEVYSASRFAQRINDAPANVTVITAAEIKQYGWRTLAEILRSVAGIDVRYDRIYDYVGVRGFSRSADYNTGLTVLVDGYRMNDNIYDTGFIGAELGLDVDLIEKVEVVRGPASALYGGNAVLGVVNVITRSARSVGGVELAARAGSFGLLQGRASFGKVLDNGAELLLSATAMGCRRPEPVLPGVRPAGEQLRPHPRHRLRAQPELLRQVQLRLPDGHSRGKRAYQGQPDGRIRGRCSTIRRNDAGATPTATSTLSYYRDLVARNANWDCACLLASYAYVRSSTCIDLAAASCWTTIALDGSDGGARKPGWCAGCGSRAGRSSAPSTRATYRQDQRSYYD
ncbi:MAG: TonB-dependent receptor plug domain-containing protein [Chromatiales bacterium]|nr:TonB-dependent receptor plug domain-containing protein [Chromatiales bacterium]